MRAWRCLRENEPASIYNKSNNGYQDVEFEAKVGEFTCSVIIVLISALKAVRSVCLAHKDQRLLVLVLPNACNEIHLLPPWHGIDGRLVSKCPRYRVNPMNFIPMDAVFSFCIHDCVHLPFRYIVNNFRVQRWEGGLAR